MNRDLIFRRKSLVVALAVGLLAPARFVAQPVPPGAETVPASSVEAPTPATNATTTPADTNPFWSRSLSPAGRADAPDTSALGGLAPASPSGLSPWAVRGAGPAEVIAGLRPYLSYRVQHARGIPNGPGERYSSTIHEVAPGISWNIGPRWSVNYSPVWTYYTHDNLEDTIDHSLRVNWRTTYQNWAFGFDHHTTSSHSVIIETGEQTKRRQFQSLLRAANSINSRLSWEHLLGHNVRLSEKFSDFREYSLEERLTRHFADRMDISLGVLYGFIDVSDSADHQHLSPRLSADWRVGQKLTLAGYAGLEHRWFNEGIGDMTNPIFDVSARYQLFENTSLYVGYNRSVSPSFFQDTVTRRELLDLSLSQRFLGRYFFTATAARRVSRYESASGGSVDGRRDRHLYYNFRVSTGLGERGSISVFYQPEADNKSNRPDFSYEVRTYGAEINYQF